MTDENIKQEVIVTGFGGQGIVLAGRILGMAAALGDHKESTLVSPMGLSHAGEPAVPRLLFLTGLSSIHMLPPLMFLYACHSQPMKNTKTS